MIYYSMLLHIQNDLHQKYIFLFELCFYLFILKASENYLIRELIINLQKFIFKILLNLLSFFLIFCLFKI
jgi:hypothetical protein